MCTHKQNAHETSFGHTNDVFPVRSINVLEEEEEQEEEEEKWITFV